jgi:DNA mismatch repair protein MutS
VDAVDQPPEPLADAAALTPMMKQYLEVKAQHPGALLFFRLGDFYELFFEDAVKASELLQITLTSRAKGVDRVPMAGVPYHAARRYIGRLIEAGQRVAICDQMEPPGKGIVRREVVRVVSPGMVLDDEVLEPKENNFLVAVAPGAGPDEPWGAAALDASTGELIAYPPGPLESLLDHLVQAAPREVLAPEGQEALAEPLLAALTRRPALAVLPADAFLPRRAGAYLCQHLGVASLEGFGLQPGSLSVGAAGAALRYLKESQRSTAAHVDRITVASQGGFLAIDEASRTNLELVRSARDGGRAGSLLAVLDRTSTSLGARRLARWVTQPLAEVGPIALRHDAVAELVEKAHWREALASALRGVGDLERLCARLSLSSGGPRDLQALGRSLGVLPQLAAALAEAGAGLLDGLRPSLEHPQAVELGLRLQRALVDEPPAVASEGGFIRAGYDAELDALLLRASGARDFLARLEVAERQRTQIQSLKVRYNKVFGYYLEVTKANLALVPASWIRKQTTVGAERYVTEELKQYEEQVLTADEKRVALEQQLFEALRAEVVLRASALKGVAESVATLDVLLSFARVSSEWGYVRPELDESTVLELTQCRHPVVERMLPVGAFVPNDVHLDRDRVQVLIITGPNMAGKSTVMRQVALTVILAQAGCFVPARKARVGLCDRVFTRVGASDDLARGHSTFMVEMIETANILHHATRRSLVVLDEIGRGTSTFDGLSIAWAVAEHLHDRVGARTLFATHYHELTDLAREKARVKNSSIAVREHEGRVVFLHTLVAGAASRSYGIEVARLAGLPPEVLARARELLRNLEAGEFDQAGRPRLARRAVGHPVVDASSPDQAQLGLFLEPGPAPSPPSHEATEVLDEVQGFEVNAATPLEALAAIDRWKRRLQER